MVVVQQPRRSQTSAAALASLLTAAVGTTMAVGPGASAAGCAAQVTIARSGSHLTLSPSSVKVTAGDCVSYSNRTSPGSKVNLSITEGGHTVYSATLASGASGSFSTSTDGKAKVSASTSAVAGLIKSTGSGSVTIVAPPSPHPSKSSSPSKPKHSSSPTKHPRVAGKPKNGKHSSSQKHSKQSKHSSGSKHGQTPQPHATGIKLPPLPPLPSVGVTSLPKGSKPLVAPGATTGPDGSQVATGAPGSSSASPVAAVIGGPIEPLDNNSRGLPVAVGVLVVLGIATGWGRALLAASGPVDRRSKGGHGL
jgi:plastocyanin